MVDKIHPTRENRKWLKERGIRITAPSIGRKTEYSKSYYKKVKRKKEASERNHIKGKFCQAKNGYNLNKIMVKTKETAE